MYILIFLYKKNNTIIISVLKLYITQGPAFCVGKSHVPTPTLTSVPTALLCPPLELM